MLFRSIRPAALSAAYFHSIRPAALSAVSIVLMISVLFSSGRKAMLSSAPQTGQISVLLSSLDIAGGAVYCRPHFGHLLIVFTSGLPVVLPCNLVFLHPV